jgi:hypothetical protein
MQRGCLCTGEAPHQLLSVITCSTRRYSAPDALIADAGGAELLPTGQIGLEMATGARYRGTARVGAEDFPLGRQRFTTTCRTTIVEANAVSTRPRFGRSSVLVVAHKLLCDGDNPRTDGLNLKELWAGVDAM